MLENLIWLSLCIFCLWCGIFFAFIAHRIYSAPICAVERGDVRMILRAPK